MSTKLDWNKLLSIKRKRESKINENDHRNEFEKDYDRIVPSSSVRRLQDKAQVFPLQENDFIRTRLTHSLEVSGIARSFGVWLEKLLIEKNEIEEYKRGQIPSLLSVVGLIHDLGNPPFGHYGEDIIKKWFKEWFGTDKYNKFNKRYPKFKISEKEKNDFLNFDGNAQSIRILTKLQFLNDQYGINFTYGTLSAMIKYPWSSVDATENKEKFGYFQKDEHIVKEIIEATTGREKVINPLTLLLEAADDISYLGADIEDGVKKGVINWEIEFEKIKAKIGKLNPNLERMFYDLKCKHKVAKDRNYPEYHLTSVQNFRVSIQGLLIGKVMASFKNNYDEIITGEFKGELLKENEESKEIIKELERVQSQCFRDKEVLTLELVGDKVVNDLLDIFVDAIVQDVEYNDNDMKSRSKHEKIIHMISRNFLYVHLINYDNIEGKNKEFNELTLYERLLLVTDFISGMTDSYAVDLHQKLSGVKLP